MDLGKPGMSADGQNRPPAIPASLQGLVNPSPIVRVTPDQFSHSSSPPKFSQLIVPPAITKKPNLLMPSIELPPLQNSQISHILNPVQVITRVPPKVDPKPLTFTSYFSKQYQKSALSALAHDMWISQDATSEADFTPPAPERKPITHRKRENNLDDTEFANYLLRRKPKEQKAQRKVKRGVNYVILPRYDEWTHVGHGYLIIPDLPPLSGPPTWTDFLFQGFLKALATGGEGNSSSLIRDEHAPLLAASARLEYSMNVDEHGIEHLKVEAKMAKNSSDQSVKSSIDYLAKLRNTLAHRLREYSDDRESVYRPPVDILEDSPEKARFYGFKSSEFYFLTYMIRMIELSSRLMPKHTMVISKALHVFVPLILAAKQLPNVEWHFFGGRLYLNYFHRLFRLLSRLSEYFGDIKTIPLRATFGALSTVRPDVTCVHAKELGKISDNIDYGGCLSWGFCVLRDLSIVVTLNPRAIAMIGDAVQLLRTKGDSVQPRDLLRCAYANKENGQLYKFRFFVDSNDFISFRAAKATPEEMRAASSVLTEIPHPVSPFYQLLANVPDVPLTDDSDATCLPELSDFILDLPPQPEPRHAALPTMGLQFRPRSRSSVISISP